MKSFLAKTTVFLLTFACLSGIVSSKPADSASVKLSGATWHSDLNVAKRLAVQENKPLLVFDLVGRLDEKWC